MAGQPQYRVQTGVGNSTPFVTNQALTPMNIGLGVYVNGTVTYTVQYTYDDVTNQFPNALPGTFTTPIWFNHPNLQGLSAQADASITTPVTAIRLSVTAGAGTAMLVIQQAGIG